MAAAIDYCFGQIRPFPTDPNNVVVLGDGFGNVGKNPVRSAANVFDFGGLVAAVAGGRRINDAKLLALVGGNEGLKFKVDDFLAVPTLVSIMEQMAFVICNGPPN